MKSRGILFAVAFFLILAGKGYAGWFTSSPVEHVKNGTLYANATTTIGKVFDASFDSPTWEAFETDKGQNVVQFAGKISKSLHDTAVELMKNHYNLLDLYNFATLMDSSKYAEDESQMQQIADEFLKTKWWPVGVPVVVQFLIHVDGENFEIGAMESDAWKGLPPQTILEIIYN